MNSSHPSKIEESLAGYVLGDVSETELQELERLHCTEHLELLNDLERVAATTMLVGDTSQETIPENVRRSICVTGKALVADKATISPMDRILVEPTVQSASCVGRWRERIAWAACLAASILALSLWQNSRFPTDSLTSPEVRRASLLAQASDVLQSPWTEGKTPWEREVVGDVVWSNSKQQGFMRFVGMPVNDPTIEQYQLWIIDPSRDDEPIDGGVFDVTSSEEAIVAIQAKLRVNQPKAFAVTVEKPGGVVVSSQERLPLLAVIP